jgi:D-glycero-D-manno-heptose 1,7-bisphosphate phosphatase
MSGSHARKALFLDRDGTLIVDKEYLSDPAGVELLPGVREALLAALEREYLLFLFSNQSGIGRGYFTLAAAEACNRRMFELLALPAPGFTEVCIAPERPDEPAVYRKPSPRFIVEMIAKYQLDPAQTTMIGDKPSDVEAGLTAGVTAVLVHNRHDAPPPGVESFESVGEFVRERLRA